MKRLARILGMKIWSMLLLFGSMLGSCDVLSEEAEDCAVYVRFRYDMNMEFTDAFQHAVNSVTLYAFDKQGVLAFQKTEEGELLKQNGYRMLLDGISHTEKADYDFITWAGEPDNESFSIPVLTVGKHTKEDLICQLNRAGDGVVDDDLESLFHGQVNDLTFGRGAQQPGVDVEIPLVKNTNSIRIVLQEVEGDPLNVNDFRFQVTDDNGTMNYDNTLLQDEVLTYKAWFTENGHVGMDKEVAQQEGITEINVAIAELTTARLMADKNPILTITNAETGEQVLKLPLVSAALMYKRDKYRNMTDQEYLDREDEYNFTFFLNNGKWISSAVYINSWKVIVLDSELN